MRTILLALVLIPTAAAQIAVAPLGPDTGRCDAPAAMPSPVALAPNAAAVDVEFDGPAPIAMPNLCGEPVALMEPMNPLRPPASFYDGDGPLPEIPEAYRQRFGLTPTPEFLRRYRDQRREGELFDRLRDLTAPDPPRD